MENDMKITLTVNCGKSKMKKQILNSIKNYVQQKLVNERGQTSEEFTDEVLTDDCGFDDETTFKDIGVDLDINYEHDYI